METCTLSLSACFEDCQSSVNAVAIEDSTGFKHTNTFG